MTSSTSSFRTELKVLGVVLVGLLLVEGGVRWLEGSLSADVRHARAMPGIVRALREAPGERVLFLGNSLTRHGVDLPTLRASLADLEAGEVAFARLHPDETDILDWGYVYAHAVARVAAPDLLAIGFALDQLADQPARAEQTRRVARHYTEAADLPEALAGDFGTAGQRGDFLLAKLFAGFAHRERVRHRILSLFVPRYQDTVREMNALARDAPGAGPAPTYARLERLLDLAAATGARVVVIALPIPKPYPLPAALLATLEERGVPLIDLRLVPGLAAADFPDGYHVGEVGAALVSRALAAELFPHLAAD